MTFFDELNTLISKDQVKAARRLVKNQLRETPLNGFALSELRILNFLEGASLAELQALLELLIAQRSMVADRVVFTIKRRFGKQPLGKKLVRSYVQVPKIVPCYTAEGTTGLSHYERAIDRLDWGLASEIIEDLVNRYTHDTAVFRMHNFHNLIVEASFPQLLTYTSVICKAMPFEWGLANLCLGIIVPRFPQQCGTQKVVKLADEVERLRAIETGQLRDDVLLAEFQHYNDLSSGLTETFRQ